MERHPLMECTLLCPGPFLTAHEASIHFGSHGPGLYTYTNPASAHQTAGLSSSRHRSDTNFVLIQCRVVTRDNAAEVSNPYAVRSPVLRDGGRGVLTSCSPPSLLGFRRRFRGGILQPTHGNHSNTSACIPREGYRPRSPARKGR